eukprot:NODE_8872_length_1464_cov_2.460733.p1 GENE.NODE_8872_length_1464_cov_2.460733~~NODE_8872_length_1464_cov_2.460733.p1  ORF type:complete len:277 (-),score=67.91 NODE_8872_length_1464_cov_2.460733:74-904(-)
MPAFPSHAIYHKVARLHACILRVVAAHRGRHLVPDVLLLAIEAHAHGVGQWLKVAGNDKARVIEAALKRRRPWPEASFSLEFGAFIGYTSVRLASRIAYAKTEPPAQWSRLAQRLHGVSLEVDSVHQLIARHLIDVCGLAISAEVWSGQVRDLLPRTTDELGAGSCFFAFMDHRGTRFHEDFAGLIHTCVQAHGIQGVADNVLNPGGPIFAWETRHAVHAVAWALPEFAAPSKEDWMAVVHCAALSALVCGGQKKKKKKKKKKKTRCRSSKKTTPV